MAAGYEVLVDELAAHSRKVDGFAERLRAAVDAARQVTMNDSAYGVICQPFAAMLQPFEETGVTALSKGVEAIADTAERMRRTAESYGAQESAEAARFGGPS
ncbi:type VII secretion target [Saccharothrix coeruleofusca]|uniref:Excreted virulence factor EspC (Type VII ESX diderm) n=1 Tax=Saccharothrix coeruleofusca TaxID=33919 RepID=A0A918AUY3_9PSEU|nr:type VII secretion target [Saccharothrix coeruleofusca]MBP2337293.1 hypothetical protein [Saccharothrix coeruleofusca]GGP88009.1 hypothetical protein GCM10010185_71900 [Saccharothrix coeruleofusca]